MQFFEQLFPLALTVILGVLDIVLKNPATKAQYLRQMAKVFNYIVRAYGLMPEFQALVIDIPTLPETPVPIPVRAAPAPVDSPAPPAAPKPPDPPAPPAAPPAPGDVVKLSSSVTQ